jgi:hypothetical protein
VASERRFDILIYYYRPERVEVPDVVQATVLCTIPTFASFTPADNRATGSTLLPDIEPEQVGIYYDNQLDAMD